MRVLPQPTPTPHHLRSIPSSVLELQNSLAGVRCAAALLRYDGARCCAVVFFVRSNVPAVLESVKGGQLNPIHHQAVEIWSLNFRVRLKCTYVATCTAKYRMSARARQFVETFVSAIAM